MATTVQSDALREMATEIWSNRNAGPTAHLVDEAYQLAELFPVEQRDAAGRAILLVGRCLSEPDGMNLLGLVASRLLTESGKDSYR
jgi:hypothetical protein